MKKLLISLSVAVLSVSAFSMSKAPADAGSCDASKTCVKDAACCTTDGSCKKDETKADIKAAEEKTGCTGGVCPLKK